jgi:hypothetical protein
MLLSWSPATSAMARSIAALTTVSHPHTRTRLRVGTESYKAAKENARTMQALITVPRVNTSKHSQTYDRG